MGGFGGGGGGCVCVGGGGGGGGGVGCGGRFYRGERIRVCCWVRQLSLSEGVRWGGGGGGGGGFWGGGGNSGSGEGFILCGERATVFYRGLSGGKKG